MTHRKIINRSLPAVVLVFITATFFAGCAGLGTKPTPAEYEAAVRGRVVLAMLKNQNSGLENFKGIGRIKIWRQGQLEINERLAWIGSRPDRLSIAVLVSGFAAIKMAADGKWFYYYEARSNPPVYKKIRAGDASLKRIIAVEIKTSDILTLLAGRVPLRDHRQALLVDEGSEYKGSVLVLKQRWLGTIEKIYLDENRSQMQAVEFFDRSGNLTYRVRFDRMQVIKGYRVPSRLVITNGEDTQVAIDIYRYQADIDVTPSMFVLPPPD